MDNESQRLDGGKENAKNKDSKHTKKKAERKSEDCCTGSQDKQLSQTQTHNRDDVSPKKEKELKKMRHREKHEHGKHRRSALKRGGFDEASDDNDAGGRDQKRAGGQMVVPHREKHDPGDKYGNKARQEKTHGEHLMMMTDDDPDVVLDIPNVSVDEITLEVNDIRAHVSLDAHVANLVHLTVGVDASIDRVKLSILGVRASALLVVRLDNVRGLVETTLSALLENPLLLDTLSGVVDNVIQPGGIVSETVNSLGQTVEGVVDSAGNTVERVVG